MPRLHAEPCALVTLWREELVAEDLEAGWYALPELGQDEGLSVAQVRNDVAEVDLLLRRKGPERRAALDEPVVDQELVVGILGDHDRGGRNVGEQCPCPSRGVASTLAQHSRQAQRAERQRRGDRENDENSSRPRRGRTQVSQHHVEARREIDGGDQMVRYEVRLDVRNVIPQREAQVPDEGEPEEQIDRCPAQGDDSERDEERGGRELGEDVFDVVGKALDP